MGEMRTIEIDFDVNKRIELERATFSETPNDVLRRLLGIAPSKNDKIAIKTAGRSWSWKGVTLPHGTELRMEYNGISYSGKIDDGRWFVENRYFKTPSAAASGVAVTKEGKLTSLDGWIYWQIKMPGDSRWAPISALRPRH